MTGAQGELYDYLAEEVVGDLDDETQRFLMTTSLLQAVDPTLAEVVGGFPASRAKELIAPTERLGLLSARGTGRRGARRYHPLVREFLESRLRRTLGDEVARDLHRAVARHAGAADWRLAAYHFAAADDMADLGTVVQAAVPTIMGSGEFALAESYVLHAGPENNAALELFVSRMELHRGHTEGALVHAELAVETAMHLNDQELSDHALANLATALFMLGQLESAREVAQTLGQRTTSPILRPIATGIVQLIDGSLDGDLEEIRSSLLRMAEEQERRGLRHYVGVTWLNIADLERARGRGADALQAATKAMDALKATSAGLEVESARSSRAWALANQNRWDEALREMAVAEATPFDAVRAEVFVDLASTHAAYGSRAVAQALLARALDGTSISSVTRDIACVTQAELGLREHDLEYATERLDSIASERPHPCFAFAARVLLVRAQLSVAGGSVHAERDVANALHLAARQGADLYGAPARILRAALDGPAQLAVEIASVAAADPSSLSMVAEHVVASLGTLDVTAMSIVENEADRRPLRWRDALRRGMADGDLETRLAAAFLLDRVGEQDDVQRLRLMSRTHKGSPAAATLGRGLARRLAPRVTVEDQGKVQVIVGKRLVPRAAIRRKALALLCFLLSRPDMSATRDQVLEALWPEVEPQVAVNSLNQTIFHLRRVIEPGFRQELTPGYIHHDSDVVWLDSELITSRSIETRAAIRIVESDPSPANVDRLSETYTGRFALEFAYEEWAIAYRESMHAAYLETIEKAVIADTNSGSFDRAIGLARRATDVDPEADEIELSLLKLYRRTRAFAAAAEQYVHYAAMLRNDLGREPPPLESL